MLEPLTAILIAVGTAVLGIVLGFVIGYLTRKKSAERKIVSAESEAKRIVDDAVKAARPRRKK